MPSANLPLIPTSMLDAVQPETISTPEPNLVLNSSALEVSSHTEPEPSAPALVRKAPKHQDPDAVVYPFVDVQLRKARAHGRKRKSVKQDPIRCGLTPITVSGITWQSLQTPHLSHSPMRAGSISLVCNHSVTSWHHFGMHVTPMPSKINSTSDYKKSDTYW